VDLLSGASLCGCKGAAISAYVAVGGRSISVEIVMGFHLTSSVGELCLFLFAERQASQAVPPQCPAKTLKHHCFYSRFDCIAESRSRRASCVFLQAIADRHGRRSVVDEHTAAAENL
jgi:hypothetical protein